MKPQVLAPLLAALLAAAMPVTAATPFKAADLYKLSMVTDPKVAPDVNRILFTTAAFGIQTDTRAGGFIRNCKNRSISSRCGAAPGPDRTVQGLTSGNAAPTLQNRGPGRPSENHEDFWKRSTLSKLATVRNACR